MQKWDVIVGDCLEVMRTLADNSVDAVVTDPPYGLKFMGKRWDCDVPGVPVWAECLRVLKPGGHMLAFAGTRTQHRMAVRIEDAGFEIRDMIAWVYGSGFPKSLDVSKAIDKAAGAERAVIGEKVTGRALGGSNWRDGDAGGQEVVSITAPATDAAKQWQGWGTALKPSYEPVTLARKPITGTVAANVLEWGTGAVNVDGCRVDRSAGDRDEYGVSGDEPSHTGDGNANTYGVYDRVAYEPHSAGRWPANFLHDGSDEVIDLLGDAARFFYCAKASKKDRDEGLECEERRCGTQEDDNYQWPDGRDTRRKNHHPTVKPTDLMRYLCRLITPPGGLILDPFAGSGSTGKAAMLEGFRFIGIEREAEYAAIARARIAAAQPKASLFGASDG